MVQSLEVRHVSGGLGPGSSGGAFGRSRGPGEEELPCPHAGGPGVEGLGFRV